MITTRRFMGGNEVVLELNSDVKVTIVFTTDNHAAGLEVEYRGKNITGEIVGFGQRAVTSSADNLLHWLSLAKDWKPENEQSCEKQIHKRLDRHLANMRRLRNLQRIDEDEWLEDAYLRLGLWSDNWGDMPEHDAENMYEYLEAVEIAEDHERESFAISVQKKVIYDIQCSWGGPSDGFLVEVDEDEIVAITYYFKDWFDGARQALSGDAFDTAKEYIQQIVYLGS